MRETSFTGSTLILDKATGFLEPGENYRGIGFTATKKLMFLQALRDSGSIARAATAVPIGLDTVVLHRKVDIAFDQAVIDTINKECVGAIESVVYNRAKEGKHPAWAFGWLKAHSEKWRDRAQISIESKSLEQQLFSRLRESGKLIEIVESSPSQGESVDGNKP